MFGSNLIKLVRRLYYRRRLQNANAAVRLSAAQQLKSCAVASASCVSLLAQTLSNDTFAICGAVAEVLEELGWRPKTSSEFLAWILAKHPIKYSYSGDKSLFDASTIQRHGRICDIINSYNSYKSAELGDINASFDEIEKLGDRLFCDGLVSCLVEDRVSGFKIQQRALKVIRARFMVSTIAERCFALMLKGETMFNRDAIVTLISEIWSKKRIVQMLRASGNHGDYRIRSMSRILRYEFNEIWGRQPNRRPKYNPPSDGINRCRMCERCGHGRVRNWKNLKYDYFWQTNRKYYSLFICHPCASGWNLAKRAGLAGQGKLHRLPDGPYLLDNGTPDDRLPEG